MTTIHNTYQTRWRSESLKDNVKGSTLPKKTSLRYISDLESESIVELKEINENLADKLTIGADEIDDVHDEDEEEEYLKKDPVRKFQFDHNVSTCLTNKFPEMLANDDGEEVQESDDFSFAPGEGKTPSNIFMDVDWDIKAWPSLHPDGKYGIHHKRTVPLSEQKYFVQRIRNKDRRFEENPGYVFAATSYVEEKKTAEQCKHFIFKRKKNSE